MLVDDVEDSVVVGEEGLVVHGPLEGGVGAFQHRRCVALKHTQETCQLPVDTQPKLGTKSKCDGQKIQYLFSSSLPSRGLLPDSCICFFFGSFIYLFVFFETNFTKGNCLNMRYDAKHKQIQT